MAQQTLNTPREATHQRIADALEDIVDKIVDTSSADNIDYDNTTSGLSANKVQSAIDELALAGFVTNTVNNLVNYYLKSETYNKTEVDSLINAVKNSRFEAVSTLPTTNIKTNVIYLVPKSPTQTNNAKDEYINLDGTSSGWEKIGDTEVDLSGYVTTTALNTALSNYTTTANLTKLLDDKVDKVSGKGLSTNDYTTADKNKLTGIEAEANKTVVDSAMSDSSTNPLQNKVITKELEGAKTATGNPITVTDAAPVNAVNLSMDLEPVQDLHGYDHPWVGGAGKNKLDTSTTTIGSITFTEGADGYISATPTTGDSRTWSYANAQYKFPLKAGNYKLIIDVKTATTQGSDGYSIRDSNNTNLSQSGDVFKTTGIKVIEFNLSADANIGVELKQFEAIARFMIMSATETDSSYAPYSNICPISGRSEVAIERVGKNLAKEIINGYIDSTARKFYTDAGETILFYAIKGKTYKVSSNKTINRGAVAFINTTNIYNNMPIDDLIYIGNNTTSWTATWSGWSLWYITNETWSETETNTQLELGSTATTYEPYAGKTYTIQLGDTVYGGTLDVTKGKMVVDKKYATVDEDSEILSGGSMFVATNTLIGAKAPISQSQLTGVLCNSLREVAQASTWGVQGTFSRSRQSITSIYFKITNDITTVEQVKTYLTSNPLQFVYELATPITIPLTPQQIKLLENTNTVYTDYEGDTIHIEYQPNNAIGEAVRVVEESYDPEFAVRPVLKKIALSGTTSNVGIYENISLRNIIPVFFKDNYGYTFLFRGASVLSFRVIGDSNEIKTNYNFSGVLYYYELEG